MKTFAIKTGAAIAVIVLAVLMGSGATGFMMDGVGLLNAAGSSHAGLSAGDLRVWKLVANLAAGPIVAGVCGAGIFFWARGRFFPAAYDKKWRAWIFPVFIGLVSAGLSLVFGLLITPSL
jgi:hypothetical protein